MSDVVAEIRRLSDAGMLLTYTWKTLLMIFVWRVKMVPKLRKIVDQHKASLDMNRSVPAEQSLMDYIEMNAWKIDETALGAYLDRLDGLAKSKREAPKEKGLDASASVDERGNVIAFLRRYDDEGRFKATYESVLRGLIVQERVDSQKGFLHPGFEKLCGLRGSKLSGGQKQRVAIARALVRNPKILILDEATSALDEKSQEIVQEALETAMEGRTSIVIAHRLSTVKKCDRIIVINQGQVLEQGTYDALSADPESHFFKMKACLKAEE